jgi:hypothetical protein
MLKFIILVIFGIVFFISVGIILLQDLYDRDSWLSMRIWCFRNNLKYREFGYVTGSISFWGEDEKGNEYSRGPDDKPVLIKARKEEPNCSGAS